VWATVSALMCLVCPVLLSVYTVLYVLFYEQINGMEWKIVVRSPCPHMFRFSQLHCCRSNYLELAVLSPLTVFGANSKLSSITLLSGLLNASPHPAPQIRRASRWHCAFYKFTYLLTVYLLSDLGKLPQLSKNWK